MIDTSKLKFPKPGQVGKTKVVKLNPREYRNQRQRVWEKQGRACRHCWKGIALADGHLHHTQGRGLGGGKRNDMKTQMLCENCHRSLHETARKSGR